MKLEHKRMVWHWNSAMGWGAQKCKEELKKSLNVTHGLSTFYRVIEAAPGRGRPALLDTKERRPRFWTDDRIRAGRDFLRKILKKYPSLSARDLFKRSKFSCRSLRTFRLLLKIVFGDKPWKPAAKGVVLTKYDLQRRRRWVRDMMDWMFDNCVWSDVVGLKVMKTDKHAKLLCEPKGGYGGAHMPRLYARLKSLGAIACYVKILFLCHFAPK